MPPKNLFLTLRIFSATGGIEKVCRVVGKALYETGLKDGWQPAIHSLHGEKSNADGNIYFPQLIFTGFKSRRIAFVLKSIAVGRKAETVILSHINLLMVGFIIKFFYPRVKLVMMAHGIEVWKPFSWLQKMMIRRCNLILAVSHFTKEKMQQMHGLPEAMFGVLNNSLDPFLEQPLTKEKDAALLSRYGLQPNHKILLTVARMPDAEQYKGYDRVIQSLVGLVQQYPALRYLLVGKYDELEKKRLDALISEHALDKVVIFAGYVPDKEMAAHFNLADIFIMPSEKEGFGIVFIEAMFYGKPVIAGNKDGSVDALCNGNMGLLIDPVNVDEISAAIKKMLDDEGSYLPDAGMLQEHFGYTGYKKRLGTYLVQ
jgi:phosphatidyl-myo-inositol dimannoside synthase